MFAPLRTRRLALLATLAAVLLPVSSASADVVGNTLNAVTATAASITWWAANGAEILHSFVNGQCTDLASQARPDVVQAVFMKEHVYSLLHLPVPNEDGWAAKDWPRLAAWAGLPTGHSPRVGALVVFQPGVWGAHPPYGHIAYVRRVSGRGSFQITQMNARHVWQVTSAWVPAQVLHQRGVSFIYRG